MSAVLVLLALASCGVEGEGEVAAGGSGDDTVTTTTSPEDDGGDETTTTTEDDGGDGPTTTEDDGGDEPATTATTVPGGLGGQEEMIRDALIQGFQSAGMTAEQATCLADGYIDMGLTDPAAAAELDIMAMMDLFSQCGVSMEDLGNLGAGMGADVGA